MDASVYARYNTAQEAKQDNDFTTSKKSEVYK